jgi:aconitate decarboxylase
MGSAAAAPHLLQLAPEPLAHAFGIAASRCGGLSANTGSMVKCTHCGNAAAGGLEAALMAARGYTAHPAIFDAPRGYVETFFPQHFDYEALLAYGRPFRCVDPGMAIKFFPSKFPTHFVIAAALGLRQKIGDPARIARIEIVTPDIDDADRPHPRSGLEGKFSFQYCVATALVDGHVGTGSFTDALRFRPVVVDLLAKTALKRDPGRTRDTSRMAVDVEVVLDDGSRHRETCSKPPGFWGEPVDRGMHAAKVRDCLAVRLPQERVERVMAMVGELERLTPPQVGELLSLLG